MTDALSYLDAVNKPDMYNHFLDIMKDFKSQTYRIRESTAASGGTFAITLDTVSPPLGCGTEVRLYLKEDQAEYLEAEKEVEACRTPASPWGTFHPLNTAGAAWRWLVPYRIHEAEVTAQVLRAVLVQLRRS
ncbi:hypothetical protein BC826DRAFT_1105986 [Russula brevipes]|nr:hypothetical protein BC826DRAFT_1105986 [Russula brevipes]